MKAKLLPLEGKYYGTEIEIEVDGDTSVVTVSFSPEKGIVSDRELERIKLTREEFENDEERQLYFDWSHTEYQSVYEKAKKVVKAINSYEEPEDSSN